jgi:hypothetical protein
MDSITAMLADVDVRPDAGPKTNVKAAFAGLIEYLPPILVGLACMSLICAVGFMSNQTAVDEKTTLTAVMKSLAQWQRIGLTICFLLWVISMGCIGGVSSLGMQAIHLPEGNSAIDISDRQLAMLRVILGGLFALVLTLAIESDCFLDLCHFIGTGTEFADDKEKPFFRAFVLILPFLLGFSTSLVMMVINQLQAGVLAFFGRLAPGSGAQGSGAQGSGAQGSGAPGSGAQGCQPGVAADPPVPGETLQRRLR